MIIGSGKAIKLLDETVPFINKFHNLKDTTCVIGVNICNAKLAKNYNLFSIESRKIDSIIIEIEQAEKSKYINSLHSSNLSQNFTQLLNKMNNIKTEANGGLDNSKIDFKNKFGEVKSVYEKILIELQAKHSNDFNNFKFLRFVIISTISMIFLIIGVVLYYYNKNKILDFKKIQSVIKQYKQQKLYLENLIQSTPTAIAVLDKDDVIIRINGKFTQLFGYSEKESIGKKLSNLIVPESLRDEGRLLSNENMLIEGKSEKETQRQHKNGKLIDVFVVGTAIISEGKFEGIYAIYQDISQRKQYENELIESKVHAEKADKLKSVFLAQMSHEIRTPINAMVSLASLLKEDLSESVEPDHKLSLELINKSGNRIIRTVDLLLNLSEIQTGTYQPIMENFDLYSKIIEKVIAEYKSDAREKKIELSIDINTDNTNIRADSYTVHQIFVQLIDNAIKYTDNGKILIKLFRTNSKELTTEVIDTGIGISKEYMPKLFDSFSQEEMGYSRKYDGNGIGLALVKKYCELNKAQIEVESEKNKGSLFRIIFNNSLV